jgi:aspartate/methionine/tyrosine aminotransferase
VPQPFVASARPELAALDVSKIREVANAGIGRSEILPFWFGEPDRVTPDFIREAGVAAINAGDTFYTHNFGIAPLREALATYSSQLHGPISAEHIAVVSSGMSAIMLTMQALLSPGSRVVAVTPIWPNLLETPKVLGAHVVGVPLNFSERGWTLDVEKLLAALTPETRMLSINSPGNPTGWVMPREQQQVVLDHCRKLGIWILSDDAYERIYFGGNAAPSFLDIASREERVVSTNTFSKTWLMTGWRLGWITAPVALHATIGKLVEYNTSCAPGFVQRAGLAAVNGGDAVTHAFVARLKASRDHLVPALQKLPGVTAAMYAFFRLEDLSDSLEFCKQLVRDEGVGLAPGVAFAPQSASFVRWCFASETATLDEGIKRFSRFLERRK